MEAMEGWLQQGAADAQELGLWGSAAATDNPRESQGSGRKQKPMQSKPRRKTGSPELLSDPGSAGASVSQGWKQDWEVPPKPAAVRSAHHLAPVPAPSATAPSQCSTQLPISPTSNRAQPNKGFGFGFGLGLDVLVTGVSSIGQYASDVLNTVDAKFELMFAPMEDGLEAGCPSGLPHVATQGELPAQGTGNSTGTRSDALPHPNSSPSQPVPKEPSNQAASASTPPPSLTSPRSLTLLSPSSQSAQRQGGISLGTTRAGKKTKGITIGTGSAIKSSSAGWAGGISGVQPTASQASASAPAPPQAGPLSPRSEEESSSAATMIQDAGAPPPSQPRSTVTPPMSGADAAHDAVSPECDLGSSAPCAPCTDGGASRAGSGCGDSVGGFSHASSGSSSHAPASSCDGCTKAKRKLTTISRKVCELQAENSRLHTSASLDPSMNKEVMGQLESLLADKTRLAQENCRLAAEVAGLRHLLACTIEHRTAALPEDEEWGQFNSSAELSEMFESPLGARWATRMQGAHGMHEEVAELSEHYSQVLANLTLLEPPPFDKGSCFLTPTRPQSDLDLAKRMSRDQATPDKEVSC